MFHKKKSLSFARNDQFVMKNGGGGGGGGTPADAGGGGGGGGGGGTLSVTGGTSVATGVASVCMRASISAIDDSTIIKDKHR